MSATLTLVKMKALALTKGADSGAFACQVTTDVTVRMTKMNALPILVEMEAFALI